MVRPELAVSMTVPANPAMLPTLIVELPELPGANERWVGLAETEKFAAATLTGTVTV